MVLLFCKNITLKKMSQTQLSLEGNDAMADLYGV